MVYFSKNVKKSMAARKAKKSVKSKEEDVIPKVRKGRME